MTEVQDEDQWLYGDDKGESPKTTTEEPTSGTAEVSESNELPKDSEDKDNEPSIGDKPAPDPEPEPTDDNDNDAEEKEVGDDSDSDDEPTVTIGKIVKQPDIIRPPPPPTHRTAPTSGLKDDDFTSVGKINGVAAYDYNLMELEEKPWRKPGADLSDYFNYGFNEDTWFKYCERQKALRTNESGVGLVGLGINMAKSASLAFGSSSIPVSIVNENSKYGMGSIKKYNFPPPSHGGHSDSNTNGTTNNSPQVNTIQVMTADRRTYSNKVLMQSGYDDMDFGGYGNQDSNYYNTPPPPQNVPPFFTHPPPIHSSSWSPSVPPPGYGAPPPTMSVPPPVPFFIKEEPIDPLDLPTEKRRPKDADPERDRERRRDRDRDRDREARYRESSRRRSRSPSKSRHRKRSRSKSRVVRSKSKSKSKSRSRSHTPSHKHKKKKSKRERSERERSKSR